MIGSVIDKYEVLQKLGEGATATVYRGRHRTIGKDVAIKVLHPHLSASTRNRERFNREARAVGRLSHPNIVSILDYSGGMAEDCYIVTELVDGVTVLELLQEHGRLPSEIVILIAIELCAALAFAHQEGVIHRDLKPENIMIRRDGRVKLMDFGVARVLDEGSITMDGSLLGSPAYMSPQQALDQPLDGRSDLFSLGTVLFHASTGHVPFAGSNASVILRNIIDANRPEVLELAPMVAPALVAIIDRLLQVRAEDRPPTATVVRDELIAALAEVGLTPEHPTINLRTFLLSAGACTTALDEHLRTVLLQRGKDRLVSQDHLGALQLFNRLLAIDEEQGRENVEVISLIQALHQPAESGRRSRWWWAIGTGVGALAMSLVVWFYSRPDLPPLRPHLAESALTGSTAPVPVTTPAPPPVVPDVAPALAPTSQEPPQVAASTPAPRPTGGEPRTRPTSTVDLVQVTPTTTPTVAPQASPAKVSVVSSTWAEVWLDGRKIGGRGRGSPSDWVATKENPLEVQAGSHTLVLKNSFSEPWEETFVVAPGESRDFSAELRRLPVTFIVNAAIPRECKLTASGIKYGLVASMPSFSVREPDPASEVVFECPAPLGTIREKVGRTLGGEVRTIPVTMPAVVASP